METNSVEFFKNTAVGTPEHLPKVAAWQVKTPQNVGSLMRLCDNIGCTELLLLEDINPKREALIKKTAGMSYKNVKLRYLSTEEFFAELNSTDYQLTAIETAEGATNIFETKLPAKTMFLLGSETKGLPSNLLTACKHTIYIPMTGKCKSLNISHALAVSLFEWQRQHLYSKT